MSAKREENLVWLREQFRPLASGEDDRAVHPVVVGTDRRIEDLTDDELEARVQGIKRYPPWVRVRDHGTVWEANAPGEVLVWVGLVLGWCSLLWLITGMRFVTNLMGNGCIDADSIRRARRADGAAVGGMALAVALSAYGARQSGRLDSAVRSWLLALPVSVVLALLRWRWRSH